MVVGITNIIPYFGPFIGAIPSVLLIMLADPMKGLYFIIFVIVLQQLDGNIIGPRILGESTGLSSFWVVFAILIGGGLFGFAGMVMGVPILATIFYMVRKLVSHILVRKGLPVDTEVYTRLAHVEPDSRQLCYREPAEDTEQGERKASGRKNG